MASTPAPAYAVLRVHVKTAKTMAAIAAASEHHMQTEPSPHHDPNAGPPIVLHLAGGKTPYQAARHLLDGAKRRNRETVLCREVVLSASPSYFRPGREDQAGVFDHDRMKAWTVAMRGSNGNGPTKLHPSSFTLKESQRRMLTCSSCLACVLRMVGSSIANRFSIERACVRCSPPSPTPWHRSASVAVKRAARRSTQR
jgi:hypothetical protein